ncbi:MAG: hypothetical protein Q8O67_29890 [Deltaproteobacteria bacterium]|nr:hypothetical protein [Deltaproteobacteria bacterium]
MTVVTAPRAGTSVLATQAEAEAFRRFAAFDAASFRRFTNLASSLRESIAFMGAAVDGPADVVVRSYLQLAAEAVGRGLVGGRGDTRLTRSTLLSILLLDVVPQQLVLARDAADAAALMARCWNIGEGAAMAARWIDPYLAAVFTSVSLDLGDVAAVVAEALARVTTIEHAPSWSGFTTTTLDLSVSQPDFLPGMMHAVAAGLLCIHDRAKPEDGLVVAVDHEGRSRVIGAAPCSGEYLDEGSLPAVDADDEVCLVGAVKVPVPLLRRSYWVACLPRGFVALSAVDSQRLWLLESSPLQPVLTALMHEGTAPAPSTPPAESASG